MSADRIYRIAAMCLLVGAIGSALASSATANKRVGNSSSCNRSVEGLGGDSEEPAELTGALEPAALSKFAVLRRAAAPADQLSPLNPIGFQLDSELASFYPAYIRQLVRLADGTRYFLIPGFRRVLELPPARCLPKPIRLQLSQIQRRQRQLASEPVYCIGGIGPSVRLDSGVSCQTLAEIETGGDLAEPYLLRSRQVDLVPDGVATVRLVYRGGTTIAAPVSENAFTFITPQAPINRAMALMKRLGRKFDARHKSLGKHISKHHLTKRQRRALEKVAFTLFIRSLSQIPPKRVVWLDAAGHVLRSFVPHGNDGGAVSGGFIVTSESGSANAVPVGLTSPLAAVLLPG